ncbi:MAG: hypothetical protein WDM85_08175 [Caulobacteraceae bacterium]
MVGPQFLVAIADLQRRRIVAPRAVGVLDPKADRGDRAWHLAEDVVGGDQDGARATVRGRIGDQEAGADGAGAVAERLFDLNSRLDQIDGQVYGHLTPRAYAGDSLLDDATAI